MAKSIVLYGVFLGLIVGLCVCFGSVGVGSDQLSVISINNTANMANDEHLILSDDFILLNDEKTGLSDETLLARARLQKFFTAEIGVREKTGKNDGPRVEEYLAVTNLGKGYAWCSSFVSWVFAEAGFSEPRTPWSPALFPKNRVIWERGRSITMPSPSSLVPVSNSQVPGFPVPSSRSSVPATADVFGIYFSNLKRIAHSGFVDEWGDKYAITVEGNTNEAGSSEGDGVYRKRRPISSIYQVANWVGKEGAR